MLNIIFYISRRRALTITPNYQVTGIAGKPESTIGFEVAPASTILLTSAKWSITS